MTSQEIMEKNIQAIEIIAKNLIANSGYDTTILCEVKEITDRTIGKYKVQSGVALFDAYSDNGEFALNEKVYVLIPQSNYDNTKFIIGRKR